MATLGLLASSIGCSSPAGDSDRRNDPALWITDLYEPANDPDDHYDLAVGFADGWLDARSSLIVLDNHLGRQTGDAPAVGDIAEIVGVPPPPVILDVDRPEQLALLQSAEDATVTIISLGALTALNAVDG